MTIALISVLAIALAAWLAGRVLPFSPCPVCTGVSLTWAWLLAGDYLGAPVVPSAVIALLMGGSVVGVMYQLEKKFPGAPVRAVKLWKVLFTAGGFAAAYAALTREWVVLAIAAIFIVALSLAVFLPRRGAAKDIEEKMKGCC